MKLAAIYNVFDSEELLQRSINSIRKNVDRIIIVFQIVSNFGLKHEIDIESFVKSLDGVDDVVLFEPRLNSPPWINELNKRSVGCKLALGLGLSHFIHMDCDEFYDHRKFESAKKEIEKFDFDSSACSTVDFYKFENLQVEGGASFVPFIHKLQKNKTKLGNVPYPVVVDSTRKAGPSDNFRLFTKDELVMEHFSWIRKSVKQKLLNSTARHSYNAIVDSIVRSFDEFKIDDKLVKLNTGLIVPLTLAKEKNLTFDEVKTKVIS